MRIFIGFLALLALMLGASFLVVHDDYLNLVALRHLTPLASLGSELGTHLTTHIDALFRYGILLIAVAFFATALISSRKEHQIQYALFVFALTTAAAWLLIFGPVSIGIACEVLALITACRAAYRHQRTVPSSPSLPVDRFDLLVLFAISALAIFFRLYALNRIHNSFEGELTPYYLGATDLYGILLANAGKEGPWAPLGILFYLPIYLSFKLFGISVLAIRIASSWTSVATIWLIYLLVRLSQNRVAAICAGIFLSLEGLQIGWGRTDVHPHGSTTWPSLLLALMTWRAMRSGKALDWWLLIPFMALTWHQYPSGQTGFLVPVIVVVLMLVQGEIPFRRAALLAIILAIGSVAWLFGGPIAQFAVDPHFTFSEYLNHLGPRVFANTIAPDISLQDKIGAVFQNAYGHAGDLIEGIFIHARYLFHQDIILPLEPLPMRSTSWIVAALAVAGLSLSREKSIKKIFIAMLIAGALPAIFSEAAYPKRASTIYPVLCACAGLGAGCFWDELRRLRARTLTALWLAISISGTIVWFSLTAWQWFGGGLLAFGVPFDVTLAQKFEREISPDSMNIVIGSDPYLEGKISFLLFDQLKRLTANDVLFGFLPTAEPQSPVAVAQWRERFNNMLLFKQQLVDNSVIYKWTVLRDRREHDRASSTLPKKINILLQLEDDGAKLLEEIKETWPDAKIEYVKHPERSDRSYALIIINPSNRKETLL